MTLGQNPLLYTQGIAPFDRILPEHVVPAVKDVVAKAVAAFEKIEAGLDPAKTPKWGDFVDVLDDVGLAVSRVWGPVDHLNAVKNSPELRKAYEEVHPLVVQYGLQVAQSRTVYKGFERIQKDQGIWKSLSRAQQRVVDGSLLQAKLAGVGLDGAEKARFNEIQQDLAQLKTRFQNNVLDEIKSWSLTVTSKAELAGLPEHALELAAAEYSRREKQESTVQTGPWCLTLDMPIFIPVMEFCENRGLREKMYRAQTTIASSGDHDNSPNIDRILSLRAEMAKLLGFESFAALSVASKMAGKVERVDQLLEELLASSYKAGIREHAELEAFAKSRGCDHSLLEWDVRFWAERLKEERYQYSEDELRPYFPIGHVLKGMFALVGRIFDVRVEHADGAAPVWHGDVKFFKVFDQKSGSHIASFYLDPYSRPENKRGGAWMNDCVSRRKRGDQVEIPVAHLICNGTPPVQGKPGLMSFDQVHTLFHEFGHGLQHMLTTVDEYGVAGISGVEWDAVELPSQFMENWLYHVLTLKAISSHVDSGESLPQVYIDKILAARTYRAASFMLRQLQFGLVDMELHHRYRPGTTGETPHDVFARLSKRTSALPPRPEGRFLCAFSHIFSGGYSAGYYSYKWAEVLSADAFAAFEEVGLGNDAALRETGIKFRSTVLAMGGSEHPMDVFKRFRGREPSTKALLRHNGLEI